VGVEADGGEYVYDDIPLLDRVCQNHTFLRCMYGIFGRENTKYTVIYGVHLRFWPTLL